MKSKVLASLAIGLILITGYLHLITAGDEYFEARYMGVLFLANFLGALVSAIGIYRQKKWWGWALGALIAAGSILGYIQSRTIGMPGMEVEEWYDPIGIPAMIVEGLFLLVTLLAKPWADSVSTADSSPKPAYANPGLSVTIAMMVMIVMSYFSYQLGLQNSDNVNEHPLPQTVISSQTLEDEYGIKITLVAVTAAGGLVDVRYRIIDPVKAAKLVDGESGGIMPMVYAGERMLMPDSHMRVQKLIAGQMYFTLISNTANAVQRGDAVTIVFGNVALEPIIAK